MSVTFGVHALACRLVSAPPDGIFTFLRIAQISSEQKLQFLPLKLVVNALHHDHELRKRATIWEVSIGVYGCLWLSVRAETKGPGSSHLMVGWVCAGTVPPLDP